jgi:hypothetical protein
MVAAAFGFVLRGVWIDRAPIISGRRQARQRHCDCVSLPEATACHSGAVTARLVANGTVAWHAEAMAIVVYAHRPKRPAPKQKPPSLVRSFFGRVPHLSLRYGDASSVPVCAVAGRAAGAG